MIANMNEKGRQTRLLAAIAVLAMVVCVFAVVMPSGSSDAAVTAVDTTTTASLTAPSDDIEDEESYLITQNISVDLIDSVSATFYVADGATLTLVGVPDAGTIAVYAASSDGRSILTGDSKLEIEGLSSGSIAITTDFGHYASTNDCASSSITINGVGSDAISATSITGTPSTGNTVDDEGADGTISVNRLIATSTTTISGVEYGISYESGTNTTYYAPGTTQSFTSLAENDVVTVLNGSATIAQGTNSIRMDSVVSTDVSVTGAADGSYPSLEGTATSGTITVTGGFFSNESAGTTGLNAVGVTADSNTYYTNQIVTAVGSTDVTAVTVYGNIEQRNSVGNADADLAVAVNLTVNSDSTLTIRDNVSVVVSDISNSGTIKLFGSLIGTATISAAGTVNIGPNGYLDTENIIGTVSNIGSSNNFYIDGTPTMSSVGDALIGSETGGSDLTIPAGTTFTITGNVGLNGHKIIVEGTLVIASGASIYGTGDVDNEGIVIGEKGAIQNSGSIGAKMPVKISSETSDDDSSVILQGVSGVAISIDKTGTLGISGEVRNISRAPVSQVTLEGADITGDLTIGRNVTLDVGTSSTVSRNTTVTINGALAGTVLYTNEGSEVAVNGNADGTVAINTYSGRYTGTTAPTSYVTTTIGDNVSGITIYSSKVTVEENGNDVDYLRTYVNGTLSVVDSKNLEEGNESVAITVGSGLLYVAADESLIATEDTALTITGTVNVEGSITIDDGASGTIGSYIGAYYTMTVEDDRGTESTSENYTSLAYAMDNIANADEQEVEAYIVDLGFDVTVADGQTLRLNLTGEITQDAVLTVENGGTLIGFVADVQGKMVVYVDADSIVPSNYAVMKTDAELTTTYSGFAIAISEANPGDEITVESADVSGSLTIPEGVSVTVNGTLVISGNLTVASEAELTGGTISMTKAGAVVTVYGTLDVTEGALTGDYTLTSTGTSLFAVLPEDFNGAHYQNEDGNYVITSVASATASGATTIGVAGTVTESAAVSIDGVRLTVDSGARVNLGPISATDSTITVEGSLNANVSLSESTLAVTGQYDGSVSSSVGSVDIVNTKNITLADDTVRNVQYLYITGTPAVANTNAKASVTVASGTVTVSGDLGITTTTTVNDEVQSNGFTFAIAEGATLSVSGQGAELSADALTVDGTLAVSESGNLNMSSGALTVLGTFNVGDNASASVQTLYVGTDSKFKENVQATVTGTVNGLVNVYVSGLSEVAATMLESMTQTTQVYVEGSVYMTAYSTGNITTMNLSEIGVENAVVDGWAETVDGEVLITGTEPNTQVATSFTIGQYDALYAVVDYDIYTVMVYADPGINAVYIDGKLMQGVSSTTNGNSYRLVISAGNHEISYQIANGFSGTATMTVNGSEVSGYGFTTSGNASVTTIYLQGIVASGYDTPGTSGGSTSDDGMGLTDYLLIVLIILIVIMAIMVALRLMRS